LRKERDSIDERVNSHKDVTQPFCKEVAREVIKVFVTDLMKNGVKEKILNNSLTNVWKNIQKITDGVNNSCRMSMGGDLAERQKISGIDEKLIAQVREEILKNTIETEIMAKRKDHVGRLLIHQISPLFPSRSSADNELKDRLKIEPVEGLVPRQVIPGLVDAMNDMFGSEFLEDAQRKLNKVVEENADRKNLMDWDWLFDHPTSIGVLHTLLFHAKKVMAGMNEHDDTTEIDPLDGSTTVLPLSKWLINRIGQSEIFKKEMKRDLTDGEFQLIYEYLFKNLE
jgi:hypothetical protein